MSIFVTRLRSPRHVSAVSRCTLFVSALSLSACLEDDVAEDLDEVALDELDDLALADDDDEEAAQKPQAPLPGPGELENPDDPQLYCIPQTWSTCGPSHSYNCCPADAPYGATCYWRSCQQHILDENCVTHSTGYVDYSGCATG